MSVDTFSLFGVGKEFHDDEEALKWARSKNLLNEDDEKEIAKTSFCEFLDSKDNSWPKGHIINAYSGEGFIIVYQIDYPLNVDKVIIKISEYETKWKNLFNEQPMVISEVITW